MYVRYRTNDSWYLIETHLHVDSSGTRDDGDDDIPTTNGRGNPIPDQFEYQATHDCADTHTYEIPLDAEGITECGTDVVVAAHAVVKNRFKCGNSPDETLYLLDDDIREDDPSQGSPGELYSVVIDQVSREANLTPETTLVDDNVEYLRTFVIAATPDGATFYIVDRDTGQFGKYTDTDGFEHLRTLSVSGSEPYPGGVVQLTCSPDGTLYMWSNEGGDRGLYTVDTDTGTATAVRETGNHLPKMTGLALLGGRTGDYASTRSHTDRATIRQP